MIELFIQNSKEVFEPAVVADIRLTRERKNYPAKLEFTVPKSATLGFSEGNAVRMRVAGDNTFFGFIWTKSRTKDDLIKVIAYDQLKYLTYKDTFIYKAKKASDVIKMLAEDQNLKTGVIEDTKYVIAKRIQDNKTLFDMIYDALDLTTDNTKQLYVLYDNFGRIELKNIDNMKLDIVLGADTVGDFDYRSTLENVYNQVKLIKENKESGKREVFIAKDSSNIKKWGRLQYFDVLDEKANGKAKADALLKLYNRINRSLSFKDAPGDVRVRGGSSIFVEFHLGDIVLKNYMMVERVVHKIKNDEHLMDLEVRGKI